MNMRQTWVLGACIVVGCLILGGSLGPRPAAAQKAEKAAPGRYQLGHVSATRLGIVYVSVLDTSTGQCWIIDPNSTKVAWRDLSSPAGEKGK